MSEFGVGEIVRLPLDDDRYEIVAIDEDRGEVTIRPCLLTVLPMFYLKKDD